VRTAVLVLAFAQMVFGAASSVYPGSTELPDRSKRNPEHRVSYSTPDAFDKVVSYYKQSGKVRQIMEGAAEIDLASGEGVLVRDLKPRGTVIVIVPAKKK
jgi:hypothetical protein